MTSLFFLILIIITVFYGVLFARARSSHRKLTLMPLREHRSPLRVRLWRRWAPELNLFPSHERELALHRIPSKWQTNLSMAAIWILILVGEKQLRQVLCSALPLPPWVVYIIEFVMVVGVLYWLMWLSRGRIRRELRQQLIDAGFAICGPCGYDLRGLTESRCPECGAPFDEQLLEQMAVPHKRTPRRRYCHGCGCDLYGQVEPRCPKCGREFERES